MPPEILVLAGVNGAGKSSIAGAALRRNGVAYFNPDIATRRYKNAGLTKEAANAREWHRGRVQLERALARGSSYAFETTLGGRTMTRLLLQAAKRDHRIRVWYAGLSSPELHMKRIQARVARGGHDIPESLVKSRWVTSRQNLVRLLPQLAELDLHDNSFEADPAAGVPPHPHRLLHAREGSILHLADPRAIPGWAKPVVTAALTAWRPR